MAKVTELGLIRNSLLGTIEKISVLWMAVNGGILTVMFLQMKGLFNDLSRNQTGWCFIVWNTVCFMLLAFVLFHLLALPRRYRVRMKTRKKVFVRDDSRHLITEHYYLVDVKGILWRRAIREEYPSTESAEKYISDRLDFWNQEYNNFPGKDNGSRAVYDPKDNI